MCKRATILLTLSLVLGLTSAAVFAGIAYPDPAGGWTYIYTGDSASPGANFTALDGKWSHDNGSDSWDESAIGAGVPGGAIALTDAGVKFLRIQDTGDPRDHGASDPSNRKLMFGHSVTGDVPSVAADILDVGITFTFRARIAKAAPLDDLKGDGGSPTGPWPAGGDGYVIHDGGKGNFCLRQPTGDKIVSFSLALASDDDDISVNGLVMNKLNGTSPNDDVDLQGETGGNINILEIPDMTAWHEFWIIITADDTSTGTNKVYVYLDGDVEPYEFVVTAGTGNDYDDSYIGMGAGATPQSGAIDIDFFAYKPGILIPPGGVIKARNPKPDDGAQNVSRIENFGLLSWSAAGGAAWHHVYFGTDRQALEDATQTSPEHKARLPLLNTFFFPERVAGSAYYWRIDEEDSAGEVFKGDVWSFTTAPLTASAPNPPDGARFLDAAGLQLGWAPGFDATMHDVYFGTDATAVENATKTSPEFKNSVAANYYATGALSPEKTYYWRADAVNGGTYKGAVWSFTTAKIGGGIKAEYFHWAGASPPNPPSAAFQVPVLTRTDARIANNWGSGTTPGTNSPDPSVNVDNFSARWTGEVEIAFTETYTFYTNTDDGVILWVDGRQIINNWTNHGTTENAGTIDLVAGSTYAVEMWYYENAGGAVAELRWSSPSTPKALIPQAAFSPPLRAGSPTPGNGATDVMQAPTLTWSAGDKATGHMLFFGTSYDAVRDATTASSEYIGPVALGAESYSPGNLAWEKTYYWRVDEANTLNPDAPWKGNIWSFTTAAFLFIDDFEDYNDYSPDRIFEWWNDGYGYGMPPPAPGPYYPGNGTGSIIGYDMPPFAELTIVHGGDQAMPYFYNNNNPVKAKYSEATLALTGAKRNWTQGGVKALSLWFRGNPASVGGFSYNPGTGVFTVTGAGTDIWDVGPAGGPYHDEFHFVYKVLNGAGSITAQVLSVENTNVWAKAGVMIRNTLDPNSAHAMMIISPSSGASGQLRMSAGGDSQSETVAGITAPYWVRIERDAAGYMSAWYSPDNSNWTQIGDYYLISMSNPMYIGLAVTSHNVEVGCDATFANVTTTGTVTGNWASQDIGIISNDAEPMYVAISNSNGTTGVVVHEDQGAAQIGTWTEWNIDLKNFADQGVVLSDVDKVSIGFGNRNQPVAGGSGTVYFDDLRLYRPRYVPGKGTPLNADINNDGVVDGLDIEIMADDWLERDSTITAETPNAAGLLLHWAFNDNAPPMATDYSGKGHSGVITGATHVSPGFDGSGYALDFTPDVNDQVLDNDANSYLDGLGAITVSAWVKSRRTGTDKGFIIFTNPDGTDQRDMRYDAAGSTGGQDNVIKYGITSTGGSQQNESSANVQTTDWQHLTMTWSSGQVVRLYINGVLDTPSAQAGANSGTLTGYAQVMVGRGGKDQVGSAWDGLVDEVRIYDYQLSHGEILTLAGAGDLYVPITSPAELYQGEPVNSRVVNFKDYSILADEWLQRQIWPEW